MQQEDLTGPLVLSKAVESTDAYGGLRGLRRVQHERLQKQLFLKDKDARLRSGARGMAARKALIAMEKEVSAFEILYGGSNRDFDIQIYTDMPQVRAEG